MQKSTRLHPQPETPNARSGRTLSAVCHLHRVEYGHPPNQQAGEDATDVPCSLGSAVGSGCGSRPGRELTLRCSGAANVQGGGASSVDIDDDVALDGLCMVLLGLGFGGLTWPKLHHTRP
jgi:hypothetical protein